MKHSKKLSKLILTLALAVCLSFSSFFALAFSVKNVAFAAGHEASSILTTSETNNLTFNATSASWLRQTNATNADEAFAGSQVGASLKDIKDKTGVTTTTDGTNIDLVEEGTETYVLAIFATDAPVTETVEEKEQKTYLFYNASSSISLTKNRYYVLSYYVNTSSSALVTASIKLTGGLDYESSPINTNGAWQKRHVFIATPSDSNPSVSISLVLGSANTIDPNNAVSDNKLNGYVLFDNLDIKELTELDFKNHQINEDTINGSSNLTKLDADYNKKQMLTLTPDATVRFSEINVYEHFEEEKKLAGVESNSEFNTSSSAFSDAYWYYYTDEDLKTSVASNYFNAYNLKDSENKKLYFDYEIVTEADIESLGSLNNFEENNKVLKITNTSSVYSLGFISKSTFTIDQFGFYRVSVMVKADSKNKNAEATLAVLSKIPTGNDEDGTTFKQTRKVTAYSEGTNSTNNWVEIAVYVRGNALRTLNGQIAILASPNSTVYFDQLKVEKITSETYSNSSSSYGLDLSPISVLQSSNITNGFFNFVKITDASEEISYPLTPANWTSKTENYDNSETAKIVSGVVSTNSVNFASASSKLGNANNPQGVTPSQPINVLGIYAPSDALKSDKTNSFYYETDSIFSVSTSAVSKITLSVYTVNSLEDANFTGKVLIKLINDSGNVISDFIREYTTSGTGVWTQFTFYVRTGETSQNFKLRIGIEDAKGTVFFKDVRYTALTTKTIDGKSLDDQAQFEKLISEKSAYSDQEVNNMKLVDYVTDAGFTHATEALDNGAYRSNNYNISEVKENEKVVTGSVYIAKASQTVTLENADESTTTLTSSILSRPSARTENVIIIFNADEYYSTAKSASTFALSANSYYRISVWVKTSANNADKLTININGIDAEFKNVGSNEDNANNGYTEYVALVKTGSANKTGLTMNFTLGTTSSRTSGYALISDINYEKIEESVYTEQVEAQNENESANVVVKDYATTNTSSNNSASNNSSEDETSAENTTLMIFFLVFSSLLLIASLVVALVALGVKKLPKNQTVTPENQVTITKTSNKSKKNRKGGFV